MFSELLWRIENIPLKYIRIFLVVSTLISIGTLIGIIYTAKHAKEGCPTIDKCRYEVFGVTDPDNQTFYGYDYVFNEQWKCNDWCSDRLDILSCPANNSKCVIDQSIASYCSNQGLHNLFYCHNNICLVIFIVSLVIFVLNTLLLIITVIKYSMMYGKGLIICKPENENNSENVRLYV